VTSAIPGPKPFSRSAEEGRSVAATSTPRVGRWLRQRVYLAVRAGRQRRRAGRRWRPPLDIFLGDESLEAEVREDMRGGTEVEGSGHHEKWKAGNLCREAKRGGLVGGVLWWDIGVRSLLWSGPFAAFGTTLMR